MITVISDPGFDLQTPFDVAVVVPTTLAPTLPRALESVFGQSYRGRTQVLLGLDQTRGSDEAVRRACTARPAHAAVTVLDPGYSTAAPRGGLHSAADAGAMRTILTFAANSTRVAYLDEDCWWDPEHVASLLAAIEGHDYAYSLRWLVDGETPGGKLVDEWLSVGPGRGQLKERFGGFADPSTLMVDKLACAHILHLWSLGLTEDGKFGELRFFSELAARHRGNGTGRATAFYPIEKNEVLWANLRRARQGAR